MGKSVFFAAVSDFRKSWQNLVVVDIACKVLTFLLLAPLASLFFRVFLWLSGNAVVADEDILHFVISPAGVICIILAGAVVLGLTALELSTLMTVAFGVARNSRLEYRDALGLVLERFSRILRISGRIMVQLLLVTAPFLFLLGLVYYYILGEFDINYYISQKPPAFYLAVRIAVVLTLPWVYFVSRLLLRWFLGIPILLFENLHVPVILSESRTRMRGKVPAILRYFGIWIVVTVIVSLVSAYLVNLLGEFILPGLTHDLRLLSFGVLIVLIVAGILNLIVNFLGSSLLSILTIQFSLRYDILRPGDVDQTFFRSRFRKVLPSGRVLLWVTFVAVAVSGGILFAGAYGVRMEDRVSITAHRGASGSAPENTLAAMEQAIEEGADYTEIDVQETADGEVVVFHDRDFKRIGGVDLQVRDATLADLSQIDVGTWFSPEFGNERVPTLDQVLQLCKGRIKVNIELKYHGYKEGLEDRVIEIVEARGMESEVVVMSLNSNAVRKMKTLRPNWKTGVLTAVVIGDLTQLNVDFLAVSAQMATRNLVERAEKRGMELFVWTINDPVMMSVMISRGVDNLITDEPALAVSVLQQRAQMSSIERLLVEVSELFDVVAFDPASVQQ